jgi:K+/H+ antiporter YhaU regulatory subunit KhtT
MYHWCHLELRRYFGINDILCAETADDIWNRANAAIAAGGFTPRELIEKSNEINNQLQKALAEMIDNFKYQTNEAITFNKAIIPQDCWINNKTIGEVYFWNYTEATIVAVVSGRDGSIQASPGPDFVLRNGDTLILVSKDELSYDRVLNFLTYGIEE